MENNLTYTQVGDVLLPDLTPPEPSRRSHLLEVEDRANEMLEQMMPSLAQTAGATKELKSRDPMAWVGLMNACKAQAEEIIFSELIYS